MHLADAVWNGGMDENMLQLSHSIGFGVLGFGVRATENVNLCFDS